MNMLKVSDICDDELTYLKNCKLDVKDNIKYPNCKGAVYIDNAQYVKVSSSNFFSNGIGVSF